MNEQRDGIDTEAVSPEPGDAGDVLDHLVDVEASTDAHVERSVADATQTVTPLVESVEAAAPEELPEGDFESVAEVLGDVFDQPEVIATGAIENATVLEARDEPDAGDEAPRVPSSPQVDADPPRAATPAPAAAEAPEPPADVTAPAPERVAADGGVATLVGVLLLALLVRVNYPLRLLPPRARLAVDWIALTLVFWVPVIWIIAVVL